MASATTRSPSGAARLAASRPTAARESRAGPDLPAWFRPVLTDRARAGVMLLDMLEPTAQDCDPLEGGEPRPATFAERRAIATVGALAIVVAVGILVLALGRGATPVSAVDELTAAHPAKSHPGTKPAHPGE